MTEILNHLRRVFETDDLLRESGTETPDLVGDYSNELTRAFRIVNRLWVLNSRYKVGYRLLMFTMILGILLLLTSFVTSEFDSQITIGAVSIFIFQTLLIGFLSYQSNKLEEYEQLI